MNFRTSRDAQKDAEAIRGAENLSTRMIFEVIRRNGQEELDRPNKSLMWSAIAAGMMISFSLLGEAIFRTYLPDAPWTFLVENLGYSLGFLIVILGRLQLFTENTITTFLPVMQKPRVYMFRRLGILWAIVLAANVVGAFAAAALIAHTSAIPTEIMPAIEELSRHAMSMEPLQAFQRAIPAGILIAAIVWMLPQSEGFDFFVILVFTWLIAAGDFAHIVAGSVEMAFLVVQGQMGLFPAVFHFFLPVLTGNILGGTIIFALMVFGQVRHELND